MQLNVKTGSIANNSFQSMYSFKIKNSSISNNSVKHAKTVPFQTIQFSISTQFTSIQPIDRILSGAPTPGQSGLGSDGNDEVLHIPQNSSITGTL